MRPMRSWHWERIGAALTYAALLAVWFWGVFYAVGPTP